ncbi:MAG: NADH-quinone oxidoreductase subunit J, partial [Desulfobacterales bacterium]
MTFYQSIAEGLFFAFIILVILGSIITIRAKILMKTVLGLAVALLGVAGIYFYLGSMFLTLMQILIYVGAICIVLIFGIMVGYTPTEVAEKSIKDWRNKFLAVSSAVTAFILILACVLKTDWVPAAAETRDFSAVHLGQEFLYTYCLAFELISVILLIAIIGAIILGRGGAGKRTIDASAKKEIEAVLEEKG